MSPIIGALATMVLVSAEDGLIWVRYVNGNAGFLDPDDGPEVTVGATLLVSFEDASFIEAPIGLFPKDTETGSLATCGVSRRR